MANDTSTNATANPAQAEMDDILSSIRSGVAEEGSKVGSGSADLIDAAAAEHENDEDVLELSEMDMVSAANESADADELIDLEAFGASGESKPAAPSAADIASELLQTDAVETEVAAIGDAADEFDRLLAEISQEQQQQVVASQISKEELMADMASEEPLGSQDSSGPEADVVPEGDVVEDVVAPAPAAPIVNADAVTSAAISRLEVGTIQGPEGLQVAFPAEVLAMALRPMVQDWLAKNLPEVVEKLVKEEISKLAQS